MQEFTPENLLEHAVQDAKLGSLRLETLFDVIADANLLIASRTEVQANGTGFTPLLLEKDGAPFVAAFSSFSRATLHREAAEYVLQMNGREFFLRLPPEYGVMLNPGFVVQLAITCDAARDLRTRFGAK